MKRTILMLGALAGCLAAQTPVSFLEGMGIGNGGGNAMVFADFNNDGKLDVAEVDYAYGLTVFLGNGKGTFTQLPTLGIVGNLNGSCIATADFNGDGIPDLAVSGAGLVVLLGNGDGTFGTPIQLSSLGGMVVAGDFNGDGIPDLAAEYESGGVVVQLFFGNGAGGFVAGPTNTLGNYAPGAMISADFDNDGVEDVALALSTSIGGGNGYVDVLLGNHGGSFQVIQLAVGTSNSFPSALAVADFNGDGLPDIAVADSRLNTVSILLANSTGFGAPIILNVPPQPNSIAVADLNGDGIPDLIAGTFNAQAAIFYGNGKGAFRFEREFVTGLESNQIALADLTGHGSLYLISANGATGTTFGPPQAALTVMVSTAPGKFHAAESDPVGHSPKGVAVADFNGDGNLDAAVAGGGVVAVMLGQGTGHLPPPTKYTLSAGAEAIAAADVDNDGTIDLVTVGRTAVQTLFGNGDGTFKTSVATSPCPTCGTAIIVADVNHDGKLDVITAGNNGVAVLLGNGDGTFQTATIYPVYKPIWIAAADLNGDGNLDLIVTRGYSQGVFLLFGNSDGTFASPVQLNPAGTYAITADFNNDGKADIAMVVPAGVAIYLGNGDGTFGVPIIEAPSVAGPLVAADLNADGFVDLIASSGYATGNATFLLGHGDGTFTVQAQQYLVSTGFNGLAQLAVGDINGDGKPDLLSVSSSTNAVWTLINITP